MTIQVDLYPEGGEQSANSYQKAADSNQPSAISKKIPPLIKAETSLFGKEGLREI
jgi:hypothetical protein